MIERWRHQNVFETYLLMGPSRSLAALARETGICVGSLQKWSKEFGWAARVDVKDQKALAKLSVENEKIYLENVKKRHQQAYQSVQDKALKYLQAKTSSFSRSKSPARDATIALDIAVKGERKVLGFDDTKIKGAIVKEGMAALFEMVVGEQG